MRGFDSKLGRRQLVPAGIAIALVSIILLTFNAGAIHNQLNAWKVLPQPERLTELYYQNHAKLPDVYTVGIAQQFSFTAHNIEFRTTDYRYSVSGVSADGSQVQPLASGGFSLRDTTSKTTTVSFVPVDYGKRLQVITTLTNVATGQSQSIHYWVVNSAQQISGDTGV